MNLFIKYGAATLQLDGPGITAPVKGCHYSPGQGQRSRNQQGSPVIAEVIRMELCGSYRQITDFVSLLASILHLPEVGGSHGGPYLCYQEPDDSPLEYWYTPILAGSLQLDPEGLAQRQLGQQLLTLQLTRLDEWQHPGAALSLYFPDGTFYGAQNYIWNHLDSGSLHSNTVYLRSDAIQGDLPSRNFFRIGMNQANHALGDLYLGCGWPEADSNLPAFACSWQGEGFNQGADCTARVVTAGAADCADSQYCTFTWSATSEAQLAVTSSNAYGSWWHGRPIKPLLRLQSSRAYPDLYLKLKILVSGTAAVVYETEWTQYQANTNFVEFPTVFIPPDGLTDAAYVDIALVALKSTAGAYSLPVDVLQLWPVDGGFRRLKSITYATGAQFIVDNGYTDQVYWSDLMGNVVKPAIVGQGRRLRFLPGRMNVLYVLNITGGTSWVIDDLMSIDITPNLVKRNL